MSGWFGEAQETPPGSSQVAARQSHLHLRLVRRRDRGAGGYPSREARRDYVEDCPVFCHPMTLHVDSSPDGEAHVEGEHE